MGLTTPTLTSTGPGHLPIHIVVKEAIHISRTPSLATEWIKGKQLSDAAKIKNSDIAKVFKLEILLYQLRSCIPCMNKF